MILISCCFTALIFSCFVADIKDSSTGEPLTEIQPTVVVTPSPRPVSQAEIHSEENKVLRERNAELERQLNESRRLAVSHQQRPTGLFTNPMESSARITIGAIEDTSLRNASNAFSIFNRFRINNFTADISGYIVNSYDSFRTQIAYIISSFGTLYGYVRAGFVENNRKILRFFGEYFASAKINIIANESSVKSRDVRTTFYNALRIIGLHPRSRQTHLFYEYGIWSPFFLKNCVTETRRDSKHFNLAFRRYVRGSNESLGVILRVTENAIVKEYRCDLVDFKENMYSIRPLIRSAAYSSTFIQKLIGSVRLTVHNMSTVVYNQVTASATYFIPSTPSVDNPMSVTRAVNVAQHEMAGITVDSFEQYVLLNILHK